ncbi:conjugal transfer protein TraD [Sphingomonas lycopersici]|uniref:Conjugal transfer protein TraD n=1 Tax=Sphingomonas lycopersici TaxID=2951807 RepID=A0AA41ZA64_9SPHN|nr:conjugal transfer protein TraD [Sphingomonas lycopersici]MCW6536767.1 conjugal transfer protein TraD [Sphingomonas lycopersici]
MRKPRDFDAELEALNDKSRQLKERKLRQLGELVVATGADTLSIEQLAGLLVAGVESKDSAANESWRKRGAAFFQGTRRAGGSAGTNPSGASADGGGTPPAERQDRA